MKYWWKIASAVFKVGPICLLVVLLLSVVSSSEAGKKPGKSTELPAQVTFSPDSDHVVDDRNIPSDPPRPYVHGVDGVTCTVNRNGNFVLMGLDDDKGNRVKRRLNINLLAPVAPTLPDEEFGYHHVNSRMRVFGLLSMTAPSQKRKALFSVATEPKTYTVIHFDGAAYPDPDPEGVNSMVWVTSACGYTGELPEVTLTTCSGTQSPTVWHVTTRSDPSEGNRGGLRKGEIPGNRDTGYRGQYHIDFEALIELL